MKHTMQKGPCSKIKRQTGARDFVHSHLKLEAERSLMFFDERQQKRRIAAEPIEIKNENTDNIAAK